VLVTWINPLSNWPTPTLLPLVVNMTCIALLLVVIALSGIKRRVLWQAVCWGWLIASLANTLFALLQYFDLASQFYPWVSETPSNQIFGNLRQRNLFASLCSMGLGVLVWNFDAIRPSHRSSKTSRIWTVCRIFAAMLLGVGLSISNSRTGLMELVLLWSLVLGWRWRASIPVFGRSVSRGVLEAATSAYVLSSWLMPLFTEHNDTALTRLVTAEGICASRTVMWANMWQLVMQKPWFGWGWGQVGYAHFMTEFDGPRFCGIVDNAHNLPLHLAVTLGIPVATLVLALVAMIVYRAKPWLSVDKGQQLAWGILALIGLHSMLEFPLWHETFQFAFFLCIWYLHGCRTEGKKAVDWLYAPVLASTRTRILAMAVATGLLVVSATLFNSYARVRLFLTPAQLRPPEFAKEVVLQTIDKVIFMHEVSIHQLNSELTTENAQLSLDIVAAVLPSHIIPLTIERTEAALTALGRIDEARHYQARYKEAYPEEYAKWLANGRKSKFFKVSTPD